MFDINTCITNLDKSNGLELRLRVLLDHKFGNLSPKIRIKMIDCYLQMFCTSSSASLPVWLELFDQLSIVLNVCEVDSDALNSERPGIWRAKLKFNIISHR